MKITKEMLDKVETDRWNKGIDHDPRSKEFFTALSEIDLIWGNDYFDWKQGGDGDNGEAMMFEMDIYFELKDKGLI